MTGHGSSSASLRRELLLADLSGGVIFALVGLYMALPYLKVVRDHPYARRGMLDLLYYSPPLRGFLVGPVESLPYHDESGPSREHTHRPLLALRDARCVRAGRGDESRPDRGR